MMLASRKRARRQQQSSEARIYRIHNTVRALSASMPVDARVRKRGWKDAS